jgi:hypothetical protein
VVAGAGVKRAFLAFAARIAHAVRIRDFEEKSTE